MSFWAEGSRPFSLRFWRQVRRERRRLQRDRHLGHFWLWIASENLAECFRCGDRTDRLVATDSFKFVRDREEFDELRDRLLREEER